MEGTCGRNNEEGGGEGQATQYNFGVGGQVPWQRSVNLYKWLIYAAFVFHRPLFLVAHLEHPHSRKGCPQQVSKVDSHMSGWGSVSLSSWEPITSQETFLGRRKGASGVLWHLCQHLGRSRHMHSEATWTLSIWANFSACLGIFLLGEPICKAPLGLRSQA